MTVTSAGLLLHRVTDGEPQVLLGHMGGPFWSRKDAGAWSIPKGEYTDETPDAAARREFTEEMGSPPPDGGLTDLGTRSVSGKRLTVYALRGDFDETAQTSNTFTMTWPPRSGRTEEFPEIDRVAWFGLATAREKIVKGQVPFLDALSARLGDGGITTGDGVPGPGGT